MMAHQDRFNSFLVIVKFVKRSLAWGIGLGALLGGLLPGLLTLNPLAIIQYGLTGVIYGGFVGAIIGFIDGMIIGLITLRFTPRILLDKDRYYIYAINASVVTTLLGSGLMFYLLLAQTWSLVIICTLIATLVSAYASSRVINWYLNSLT